MESSNNGRTENGRLRLVAGADVDKLRGDGHVWVPLTGPFDTPLAAAAWASDPPHALLAPGYSTPSLAGAPATVIAGDGGWTIFLLEEAPKPAERPNDSSEGGAI